MARVLVTGGGGLVGTQLVRQLAASGAQINAITRQSDKFFPFPHIRCFDAGDLAQRIDWQPMLEGVETVIHCAARVHIMRDRAADPLAEFRAVNVRATLDLAAQSIAAGVKRFVYISSITVNGTHTTDRPFTAEDIPAPASPYAHSKWEAERGLALLCRDSAMEYVILRPPLVYGQNVQGNMKSLIRFIGTGLPFPFASIHNKRSLIGAQNLAHAIIVCASHPAAANQTFVVCDGEDISTTELLQLIAQAMEKRYRHLPIPACWGERILRLLGRGDMAIRLFGSLQVDNHKINTLLGWQPAHSLRAGLHAMIKKQ